jgi:hypothetical protein
LLCALCWWAVTRARMAGASSTSASARATPPARSLPPLGASGSQQEPAATASHHAAGAGASSRPMRRKGRKQKQLWPKTVLRKWLNIRSPESDFSADEGEATGDDDTDSEFEYEEMCHWERQLYDEERRLRGLGAETIGIYLIRIIIVFNTFIGKRVIDKASHEKFELHITNEISYYINHSSKLLFFWMLISRFCLIVCFLLCFATH